MTIKELKEILQDWPEFDEHGEPYEVWMMTGRSLSSLVVDAIQLNKNDIVFESNAFKEDC